MKDEPLLLANLLNNDIKFI